MPPKPTLQQQAVVLRTEGPHVVIAGPGSGKTYTLVERIVHLVTEKHVAPESLLVATFTEKAAGELVSRITRRLLEHNVVANVSAMYMGTLHSICLRILEERREYAGHCLGISHRGQSLLSWPALRCCQNGNHRKAIAGS